MQREIKLKNVKEAPLLMDVKVKDIDCIAIVDTGAQISIIDESFAHANAIELGEESTVGITGAAHSSDVSSRWFEEPVVIDTEDGPMEYIVNGITVDMSRMRKTFARMVVGRVIMILGTDFLEKYKAKIDVDNKTMTIDEQ